MSARAAIRTLLAVAIAAASALAAVPPAQAADAHSVVDISPNTEIRTWRHVIEGVVPGDHGTVTVDVRNVGPGPLALATWLEVTLEGDPTRSFYEDLELSWGTRPASARELADRGPAARQESVLAPGKIRPVSFAYDFPEKATGGNVAVEGLQRVVVTVKARIVEIPPGGQYLPRTGAPGMAPIAALAAAIVAVGLAAVLEGGTRRHPRRRKELR